MNINNNKNNKINNYLIKNKKAEMPFWLIVTIYIVMGLIIGLVIVYGASGKMQTLLGVFA